MSGIFGSMTQLGTPASSSDAIVTSDDSTADKTSQLQFSGNSSEALSGTGGWLPVQNTVNSMADLLAVDQEGHAATTGFYSAGDGGGSTYYWDAARAKTDHNGGTIIDPSTTVTPGATGWWTTTSASGTGCWVAVETSVVNVVVFGAKVQEGYDSQPAIQASVDSMQGSVISIEDDFYSNPITLVSNTTICGTGSIHSLTASGSILVAAGVDEDNLLENISIENITLVGLNSGAGTETGANIYFTLVRGVVIKNTVLLNGNARGINLKKCIDVVIDSNTINNAGLGWTTINGGEAIFSNTSQFVTVMNNKIENSGRNAINMFRSLSCTASGNKGHNIGGVFLTIAGDGGADTDISVIELTLSGTTVTATTADSHGLMDGAIVIISGAAEPEYNGNWKIKRTSPTNFTYEIAESPSSPATGSIVFRDSSGKYCIFQSNTADGIGRSAIVIENGADYTVVSGNSVTNLYDNGILLSAGISDGPVGCVITDNVINNIKGTVVSYGDGIRLSEAPQSIVHSNQIIKAYRYGVRINGSAENSVISSNDIISSGSHGVSVYLSSNFDFINNTIDGSLGYGFRTDYCNRARISGNNFYNVSSAYPGLGRAIQIQSESSANELSRNNIIDDNGYLKYPILFTTAGTVDNYGYLNNIQSLSATNLVRYGNTLNLLKGSSKQDFLAETLVAARTIKQDDGPVLMFDPNGADRDITPETYFGRGFQLNLVNTGAANNLIFDPLGVNITVATGTSQTFIYDGILWHKL